MKKVRIIFVILVIAWMVLVFCFSHQPSDKSKKTSSRITQKIVTIFYGHNLSENELEIKSEELDPIIRKLAHYTLYTLGGILIFLAVYTYKVTLNKKILLSQIIGSIYSITDELHQYFIPRKKLSVKGYIN